jgi:hypothetical protein
VFIVARKTNKQPEPGKRREWLYWDGANWVPEASKAKTFPDRATAIVEHGELMKKGPWPAGTNPLVVSQRDS